MADLPEENLPAYGISDLEDALLSSDRVLSTEIMSEICSGKDPFGCINDLIIPALERIGKGWEKGEIALSQVYVSGKICEEFITEAAGEKGIYLEEQPRIAIAVLEDHHMLGKQTVVAALHAAGLRVTDYGAGISAEELSERAVEDKIEILLISTLMLRAALRIGELVKDLKEKGSDAKVIVGGAPFIFEPNLWKAVGPGAFGATAL